MLLIADFYDIVIPRSALKIEIKEALHTELVKQKVLPGATVVKGFATTTSFNDLEAAEAEFESEDDAHMDPVNPLPKDPLLAVRLKNRKCNYADNNTRISYCWSKRLSLRRSETSG